MNRFDDITPIEEPWSIGGEEYILRETSGDAAVKYDNARLSRHEYQDGKLVRLRDYADLEPLLVSLCLFTKDDKPVPESTIRSWPARLQKKLHERARFISRMNRTPEVIRGEIETLQKELVEVEAAEQAAKNLPSGTTAG
jgi:hypothetical protein